MMTDETPPAKPGGIQGDTQPASPSAGDPGVRSPLIQRTSGVEMLFDRNVRQQLGIKDDTQAVALMIELSLSYPGGLVAAEKAFRDLYHSVFGDSAGQPEPELVANTYMACTLSPRQAVQLVAADLKQSKPGSQVIYHVWPDFPVHPLIYKSASTINAEAAQRSFGAAGTDIVWGLIDSGIDEHHPHFAQYETLGGTVKDLHRDFTGGRSPLTDGFGHGTHVAGIIGGGLPDSWDLAKICLAQHVRSPYFSDDATDVSAESIQLIALPLGYHMRGMAPSAKLVSLKVLDENGNSKTTDIMRALQYVREEVNANGKNQVIHGVNLSLGYEFDARWYACGQSPLCVEVNRLVQTGVVVVVAAGNTGYGFITAPDGQMSTGLALTINDPGNAALAMTVGATHRDSPHTYGVSYFSSKGPTGDGRLKPDIVAPGERIVSCAAGKSLALIDQSQIPANAAVYIDDTGTSMAAPHVSGAVAAFLSIRREFIGQPNEVKRIFLENATTLGRERHFEGYGLVDLMRAIQAV
ncbi:MAG TPA: S8 family peptidase [Chloroflexota bacterium]